MLAKIKIGRILSFPDGRGRGAGGIHIIYRYLKISPFFGLLQLNISNKIAYFRGFDDNIWG